MKTYIKNNLLLSGLILLTITITLNSCGGEEEVVVPPPTEADAPFTYQVDSENPNMIHFTGNPQVETWFEHWDFGDYSVADGTKATKTYLKAGEYIVNFKIFTTSGTAKTSQNITIENDFGGPNLVVNGELEGDENWTTFEISGGVDVTFVDGKATWTGGGWGQMGIYQEINAEANKTYQIDVFVSGSGATDSWFEVYLGQEAPQAGVDYTDGGMRMGLNTWNGCGNAPFQGLLSTLTCNGGDGTFALDSEATSYLVLRCGGDNLGDTGITIDDISIREVE